MILQIYKTPLNICLRHRIVVCPLLDLVKVAAHVLALVVGPKARLAFLRVKCKHVDV
jgi:hypothetical protein